MSSGITQAPAQLNIRAVSDEPLTICGRPGRRNHPIMRD